MLYYIFGDYMNLRRENFIRIAENRTNKLLSMIDLLGNLSNKSYYEYTDKEIDKIFDTLKKALESQRKKFESNKTAKFKL